MQTKLERLAREIESVDRRIDNMRYLVVFQEKKRERIAETIRNEIGRSEVRTKFVDFDARRNPKTNDWCIMCQKDLDPDVEHAQVRLLLIDGAPHVVHAEDIALMNANILKAPNGSEDVGIRGMGADCAKVLGSEWIWQLPKKAG